MELHILLSTLDDYKNKSNNISEEAKKTFLDRSSHFDGIDKQYKPFSEEDKEFIPPEKKEIITTVAEKIRYIQKDISNYIDKELTRNETNTSGTAIGEININGKNFKLSVCSLMDLEKQLVKLRYLYCTIPTLDPARAWKKDPGNDRDIYISEKEIRYRTKKNYVPLELAKATKEHKAQVQIMTNDVQVGQTETLNKSGKLTSKDKSVLLSRIDELLLIVKQAKAEANKTQVIKKEIGNNIFEFINKDII